MARGVVCGVVAFVSGTFCAKATAGRRDTNPKNLRILDMDVIRVSRKIQGIY
jgi:hypothetical protein